MIALELAPWLLTISGWAYSVLVVCAVLAALIRKREPAQALGWSLAIVFLPVVGLALFAILGNRRTNRRLARKISHHVSFEAENPPTERGPGTRETPPGERRRSEVDRAPPASIRWSSIEHLLQRLDQPPRRPGNRTTLYVSGARALSAMREAIAGANHHIHIEFYIFRPDEVGTALIDLLCEKARAGVEVRLLVDGIGSFGGRRLRARLHRSGGSVVSFLPLGFGAHWVSPNLRNHRKIVVCDGQVAFLGGLNIGREYLGRRRNRGRDWADLHMRVEGPAVADLQWIFAEDWDYCTGQRFEDPRYFAALPVHGGRPVQIVAGGPDLRPNPVRQVFLAALARARRRIVISTPYLVPDLGLRDMLTLAARSGVRVEILTQHPPPDSWTAFLCSLYYAGEMDEAGVRVFGYPTGLMHGKAIVVDSEWAMLGSANLDNRSMFLNFELMAVLDGGPDPKRIEDALDAWLHRAVRIDRAWIDARPWYQRVLVRPARLLAPLL